MAFFHYRNKENTDNKQTRVQLIQADTMHAQLYFQNPPNEIRICQLIDAFDWNKFQPLDVSFRDNKYNVVDGQNRLVAVIRKFGEKQMIPCYIRYGMSEVEEMELFVSLAQDKRHVSPMEIYKAWYGAGKPIVVHMVNTINQCGLVFDFKTGSANGRINCPVTIMNIIAELGFDDFKRFVNLLSQAWNGDKLSLKKDFVDAMYVFFKAYMLMIDDKRFIKTFQTTTKYDGVTASKIKAKGTEFASKTQGIAQALRFFYNKSIKDTSKRLPEIIF